MSKILVDILSPNTFEKSGTIKCIEDAWQAGDWIGTFNLWIVRNCEGVESLLYQQRSFQAHWSPGLLDVSAGGHYEAGETIEHGLREVREELGKNYRFDDLLYLGKKLYLRDQDGRKLRYIVDVFIYLDNSPLYTFQMERNELEGLYCCPITELIKVHTRPNYSFEATGIKFSGETVSTCTLSVTKSMFPYNWDSYHFKIALLAQRFFNGDPYILY